MKNCKKISCGSFTTIATLMRETGFSSSGADTLEVSIKDGTIMLKPTVSSVQAEKLANAFLMKHLRANYDFEVNSRQRVIACAVGGHVGVAYCSKEDSFNVTIGKALALSRATRIPLPLLLQTYLGLD